jgi:hypothetical protein
LKNLNDENKPEIQRLSTEFCEADFPDECGDEGINQPYFNIININHKVLLRDKSENTK